MLLCWIMNEWHRIRTLIITWLNGEVRSLWLRTSHIVLAQSFSNPLVRSNLPPPIASEAWEEPASPPLASARESSVHSGVFGDGEGQGHHFCSCGFLGSNSGSRQKQGNQQHQESISLPSFGGRGVTFLSKSLQWLSANYNSSDDIPALTALLLSLRSKPNQSTVHTTMPIYPAFPPLRHSQCL